MFRRFAGFITLALVSGRGLQLDYLRKMMLRDWQFRRQLLSAIPLFIFVILGGAQIVTSNSPSPFSAFVPAHFMPHA